jgi:hypothetical protein
MNTRYLLPLLSLGALLLSGCASLSEGQCRTADWESIGYRDGTQGYDAARLGAHTKACGEYGIRADQQLYEQGRLHGLEQFCTGYNGMRLGRSGYSYSGVCPLSLQGDFMRGYEMGRELHAMDARMQQNQSEVQRVQTELKREEPPLSDKDRDYLLYRLRELEREYGRYQVDLRDMETRALQFSTGRAD